MTEKFKKTAAKKVSRRGVLKGAAATAGVVAGSRVIGAPMIWAQNIKDIVLNHTGMSYSTIIDISRQASKDLGFKVEMSVTDHAGLVNRMVNDPTSIDIADSEMWQARQFVPRGATQSVDVNRITLWDKVTPIYTQGRFLGKELSRQGISPIEVMYRTGPTSSEFAAAPTQFATFLPGVYNADTLGIRPDLITRPIDSWADLFDPEFSGKAAIQNIPSIGIMDAAIARGLRLHHLRRQGQHDHRRDRSDRRQADRAQAGRPLARAVEHLR